MDVISSSGYYPIHQIEENFERIRAASEKAGKPFLFMECGCPARGKSDRRPNDWRFGEGTDPETQRRWYERFLQALAEHPWIRGTGWWDWSATRLYPEQTGPDQNGYCTYGKPANDLLKAYAPKLTDPDRDR